MAKFVKMRIFHTKWEKKRFWAIFRAMRVVWGHVRLFVSNIWSFFGPKMTQNDPKWPKMTPKWLQNDPKMIPKWPEIDFPKNVPTSFLTIFGVVWGHFTLFCEFWSFLDPETPSNGHIWALKWAKNEPKLIFQREARSARKRAKRLKCGGYASRAAARLWRSARACASATLTRRG